MEQDNTYLFEEMPVAKATMKVSLPAIMGMLVMILYTTADTYFVSMLNDPIQNAAVQLVSVLILAFNAVNNLFGIGASSLLSRALGKKDDKTAYESAAFGIWGCIFSGLLISLTLTIFKSTVLKVIGADSENIIVTSKYMFWAVTCGAVPSILNVVLSNLVKGEGSALHAAIGTMSGCILNIILDPIFILPQFLNMGAEGAGLATFISNTFACVYYFVLLNFIRKNKTFITFDISKLSFRKDLVKDICGVGVPAAIQNLLNVTGQTILNNFASAFGSAVVSAIGIAHKVTLLPLYVSMGISNGVTPLIGYNYASGNSKRMKEIFIYVMKISVPMLFILMLVINAGASNIVGWFMKNEDVIYYGTYFIKGMSYAIPFWAIDFIAVGVFQAIGKGKYSLVFAIMRKVVLEIPLLIILNKLYPLYGLPYAQVGAEFVLCIAAIYMLKKIFSF